MTHVELQNCKNEQEVKALAENILGEGAWEKLSHEMLEKSLLKNWNEQKGYEGVLNDLENSKVNNAYEASINATIVDKIKGAQ
ncbi:hypothetical protein J2W44_006111 [Priestia aryabhattai]|uniref:hypothetical protein n=1 Tax=Priestia aryabhattai TaxID=412384 RepID=UPI0027E3D03A|nr:hypothetical protein [Priestia aryabhattai]MDP9726955.1 hypothetical protein [Priestia aryabhattai]